MPICFVEKVKAFLPLFYTWHVNSSLHHIQIPFGNGPKFGRYRHYPPIHQPLLSIHASSKYLSCPKSPWPNSTLLGRRWCLSYHAHDVQHECLSHAPSKSCPLPLALFSNKPTVFCPSFEAQMKRLFASCCTLESGGSCTWETWTSFIIRIILMKSWISSKLRCISLDQSKDKLSTSNYRFWKDKHSGPCLWIFKKNPPKNFRQTPGQ